MTVKKIEITDNGTIGQVILEGLLAKNVITLQEYNDHNMYIYLVYSK